MNKILRQLDDWQPVPEEEIAEVLKPYMNPRAKFISHDEYGIFITSEREECGEGAILPFVDEGQL